MNSAPLEGPTQAEFPRGVWPSDTRVRSRLCHRGSSREKWSVSRGDLMHLPVNLVLSMAKSMSSLVDRLAGRECSVVRQDRTAPLFRYGTVSQRPLKLVAGSSCGGRGNGMQPDVSIINWHEVCLFTNVVAN